MAKKKVTHTFKTRKENGKRMMICRNSIEDQKHWSWQFLGDKPRCQHWSEVGAEATAVLCYRCVAKTVGPPEIKGGYVSKPRKVTRITTKNFRSPEKVYDVTTKRWKRTRIF